MKKSGVILFPALVIMFVLLSIGPVFPLEGMVTRIESNGNVVINRGINAQVRPKTDLYVTRAGEPVGKIQIIQVDDYTSVCMVVDLVSGMQVQVGDTFSETPFEKPQEKPAQPGEENKKDDNKDEKALEKEREKTMEEKMKSRQEYEKKVVEDFKNTIKKKTVIIQFKKGSGGSIKISAFDTYNLLSTVIAAGGSAVNPWYAASYAYGVYADSKSTENPKQKRNVQMEVTHWDTVYLDAYAAYYAYKEVVGDPKRVKIVRENIYRQKGLDKFYVFQVKISNPGPGAIQLAPFPWHFYLIGKGDKRLKADHYDEILDKALNPNQVVNGYIYFKRYDEHGQPVADAGNLNVQLEDILGNRRKIDFK